MMVWRNFIASALGRWNEFRPMMEPTRRHQNGALSNTFLSSLLAPPEK
jgi:hypothetical protein